MADVMMSVGVLVFAAFATEIRTYYGARRRVTMVSSC